ncbi:hypothetical protein [Streptosporangium vulgare]|uniref:hypothetical protein n=1 Tax=Streptosporangium vulgare TaxID=46190 RepID=UPI0031DFD804
MADAGYKAMFGDDYIAKGIIPPLPATLPDYTKASISTSCAARDRVQRHLTEAARSRSRTTP